MSYDALALANFFLDEADKRDIQITNMHLLKIIFFAHSFYLGEKNEPLIENDFEAWEHGPVNREIYFQFRGQKSKPIKQRARRVSMKTGELEVVNYYIDNNDRDILVDFLDALGRVDAFRLSRISHADGGAWDVVWNETSKYINSRMRIDNNTIRDTYRRIFSAA